MEGHASISISVPSFVALLAAALLTGAELLLAAALAAAPLVLAC